MKTLTREELLQQKLKRIGREIRLAEYWLYFKSDVISLEDYLKSKGVEIND